MPGTEASRSSAARQAGVPRMASSRSVSSAASSCCSHARCASRRRTRRGSRSWRRRWRSLVSISTSWRRRATSSPSAWAAALGTGRGGGWTASAKRAMASASRRSVLARRPVARAKSRICLGLTTTRGSPAAASAPATATSKPPVASSTTSAGASARRRPTSASSPAPSRLSAKASSEGRRVHVEAVLGDIDADEGRRSRKCSMTRPCECGLGRRPAPATVRVREPTGGRGAELTHGLVHPRGTRAPVRRQARPAGRAWQLRDTRGMHSTGVAAALLQPFGAQLEDVVAATHHRSATSEGSGGRRPRRRIRP